MRQKCIWVNSSALKRQNKRLMNIMKNMDLVELRELVAQLEYDMIKYDTINSNRPNDDTNFKESNGTTSSESSIISNKRIENIIKFIGEGEDLGIEKQKEFEETKKQYLKLIDR